MSKDPGEQRLSMSRARAAVIGYGTEAKLVATGLRRSGNDVVIGVGIGGMSWVRAQRDGFVPKPLALAVTGAEVVSLHVPNDEHCSMYWNVVAPYAPRSALIAYGRALALATGAFEPQDHDVVVVSGDPSACRVAVHVDASGRTLERAIAFARAAYGSHAQIGTTTVAAEAEREIEDLATRAGGRAQLIANVAGAAARVRESHAPDEARIAFFEGLLAMLASPRAVESTVRLATGRARRGVA
jgi:ketol-acid reductoisomerase